VQVIDFTGPTNEVDDGDIALQLHAGGEANTAQGEANTAQKVKDT
jgi:hypothetical protein